MACERLSEARLVLIVMLDCNTATLQYIILYCEVKLCSHFAYSKKEEYLQVSQDKLGKHYSE